MDGFILTTLKQAKEDGVLRQEAVRMAGLLGMEFNEFLDELGLHEFFSEC